VVFEVAEEVSLASLPQLDHPPKPKLRLKAKVNSRPLPKLPRKVGQTKSNNLPQPEPLPLPLPVHGANLSQSQSQKQRSKKKHLLWMLSMEKEMTLLLLEDSVMHLHQKSSKRPSRAIPPVGRKATKLSLPSIPLLPLLLLLLLPSPN
jgi:hypothetical protein